jgi:hypothetical protein
LERPIEKLIKTVKMLLENEIRLWKNPFVNAGNGVEKQ